METPTGLDTPLGQMLVRMSPENLKDQIFKAQFNLDKLKALPQLILEANYGKKLAKEIFTQEIQVKIFHDLTVEEAKRADVNKFNPAIQAGINTYEGTKMYLAQLKDPKNYKKGRSQKEVDDYNDELKELQANEETLKNTVTIGKQILKQEGMIPKQINFEQLKDGIKTCKEKIRELERSKEEDSWVDTAETIVLRQAHIDELNKIEKTYENELMTIVTAAMLSTNAIASAGKLQPPKEHGISPKTVPETQTPEVLTPEKLPTAEEIEQQQVLTEQWARQDKIDEQLHELIKRYETPERGIMIRKPEQAHQYIGIRGKLDNIINLFASNTVAMYEFTGIKTMSR